MQVMEDMETDTTTLAPDERAATEAHINSPIKIEALKELALTLLKEVETLAETRQGEHDGRICLAAEVRRFESDLIRWALVRTNGHQRRAARLLNIKVTTLNAKIKRYGIVPDMPAIKLLDMQFDAI